MTKRPRIVLQPFLVSKVFFLLNQVKLRVMFSGQGQSLKAMKKNPVWGMAKMVIGAFSFLWVASSFLAYKLKKEKPFLLRS